MASELDPAQLEAVTTDAQPLAILAGAGSGKTRVLTRRIAHRIKAGSALPQHVLTLTFTRRAAAELSTRLAALGVRDRVAAGTFHAIAYAQLRRRWADQGIRPPALLDHKVGLLGPMMPSTSPSGRERGAGPSGPERGAGRDTIQPGDVAAEIEWAKARLVTPDGYEAAAASAARRPPLPAAAIATLYERYEQEKRKRALIDFDDLIVVCGDALHNDSQFATTQRWRFRHLFVDEFQDVNPAQLRLLTGWLGDRSDLCVVGDPDQAIYGWNGADARPLREFRSMFPSAGTAVVRLDRNYRSSPQILAAANAVLDRGTVLHPTQPEGKAPCVERYATDNEEARAVASELRRRRGPNLPWSHLAVLARTHGQLVLIEAALAKANIPFRLRGAVAFLERPEIRDAIADLRRRPAESPLSSALPDLHELARDRSGSADSDSDSGAQSEGPAAERHDALLTFSRLASEQLAIDPSMTVSSFLGWLISTLRVDAAADIRRDAVELATFHAAKGLEWPIVFLVGLEQGLVPIGRAETADARAEERRLLYVAVTRAERELHCSWAERRTFGARTLGRSPSPWLESIEATVRALAEGRPASDWRRYLDDTRAQVRTLANGAARGGRGARPRPGDNADPEVVEALKSWRARAARAAGVPAYVVLHDTTLGAIAEAQPADTGELLSIPGVGPLKVQRYGPALLGVVARRRAATSA
ncbi:MAG TPA: ATP-dependent DNA helicase UvrD2 [Acidimicrobiales bacterium]|nr:ATP-dependent DNA helicase UvrD2 [Acidimicrobiales bacterium]